MAKRGAVRAVPIYLERGTKRTFACAVEWPGWSRSGRDDAAALQALFDRAPRYERVVAKARLGFSTPRSLDDLKVVQRLAGNATTDFGAPGVAPREDGAPLDRAGLERLRALLEAGWAAFDAAVAAARGRTLVKGPRGGGRDLNAIVRHVREAEAGYLGALGWRFKPGVHGERALLAATREAVLEGLAASARGEIPAKGPRGGMRWKPRFFARRLAWHALDHLWEIEDRSAGTASGPAVSASPPRGRPTPASERARPGRTR